MLNWEKRKNPYTGVNYYYAEKDEGVFQIIKKGSKWYTSAALPDGFLYSNWQLTKTLKAAKAACENYAHYNL